MASHYVYIIGLEKNRHYEGPQPMKIGHASDPARRLGDFQTGNFENLGLLGMFKFPNSQYAKMAEKIFHAITDHKRVRGEWVYADIIVPTTILRILQEQGDDLPNWFNPAWMEQQSGAHPYN